jgi:hypothetical protein
VYESIEELWPRGEQKLWDDLLRLSAAAHNASEDEELLPVVVSAAFNGVDIAEQFPAFYQKMFANRRLQEAFLDALRTLEDEHAAPSAGLLERLPQLSDPLERLAHTLVEKFSPDHLRITWFQGIAQLQAIFFPASPDMVYRSEETSLEDLSLPVLRSQARLDDRVAVVELHMLQKLETPELLYPTTVVMLQAPDGRPQPPVPGIPLRLAWGGYQAEAETDADGRACFPALPLSEILDATGEQIVAPLALSLETAAA